MQFALTPKAFTDFRFELTPKALANFSPGFEEREPWVSFFNSSQTLKGFANRLTLSGFGPSLGI